MLPEVVWIFTTPIAVPDILAMVQAIPDPRWRFAFQLLCAFGLRPEVPGVNYVSAGLPNCR